MCKNAEFISAFFFGLNSL